MKAPLILVLILGAVPQAAAQIAERGLRVEGLSFSETYFTQGVPAGIATYGDVFLGSGISVTGAASIRWTRTRHKSFTIVRFSPTYGGRFGDLSSRTWNEAISFRHRRLFGSKWAMSWSGSAQVMNFEEALYGDSTLTQIASTAITFDDLTGAILRGQSSDAGSTVGSPYPDRGIQDFLLGRRMATAGATSTFTYAYSSRLSISAVAGGMLARHLNHPSDIPGFVYPKVNSLMAGIGATYWVSRRTQIGVSANLGRSDVLHSSKVITSDFTGTISRTLSRRWFVQGSLGFGSETQGAFRHMNNRYSAGLGFKTFSHTALVTFDRGFNDPYASAVASLEHARSLTATWHYARPGSSWAINSAFSQLIAIYRGVPGTDTWLFTQTLRRQIGRNYSVALQFTTGRVGAKRYIQDGRQYQLEQTGVRTTFLWSPRHQLSQRESLRKPGLLDKRSPGRK